MRRMSMCLMVCWFVLGEPYNNINRFVFQYVENLLGSFGRGSYDVLGK